MTEIASPAGRRALARRVRTHPETLAMLRAALATPEFEQRIRSLSSQAASEPAVALLDAFAVVSDTVAFYSERIADEGYLRTATERGSVRELARTLGTDLRQGVSAQVSLVFTVDDVRGSPGISTVPAGMPTQSIPGPGELPQTFETGAEFVAHAEWNAISAVSTEPQAIENDQRELWIEGRPPLRTGDVVLAADHDGEAPLFVARILKIDIFPDVAEGWTRVDLDLLGESRAEATMGEVNVYRFTERDQLFGAHAPDPTLLAARSIQRFITVDEQTGMSTWTPIDVDGRAAIEVDGDHPAILPDSWLVLQDGEKCVEYRAGTVAVGGSVRWGLSGKVTQVTVNDDVPKEFSRAGTVVHAVPVALITNRQPASVIAAPRSVLLDPVEPHPVPGQPIVVSGDDTEGIPHAEEAVIKSVDDDERGMTLTFEHPLTRSYRATALRVHANVVIATHGETVRQVLGSGDGQTRHLRLPLRRGPLTHLRALTPSGAAPAIEVFVDDVRWTRSDDLGNASPTDRVYRLVQAEPPEDSLDEADVTVQFGDGFRGAVPATGVENIVVEYRVGTGMTGVLPARRLQLLPSRPHGMASVDNPLPTRDAAPADDLETGRRTAPLRVRTLERVVSVTDYADAARGYAGIAEVRSDAVWNGRTHVVVVSVLAHDGRAASEGLREDLRDAINLIRDTTQPWEVLPASRRWFGVRVNIRFDPAFRSRTVEKAVRAALERDFGAAARQIAQPATTSAVLLTVHDVPGVASCTMPRLFALPDAEAELPNDDATAADVLVAAPARWDERAAAAEILAVASAAIEIGQLR